MKRRKNASYFSVYMPVFPIIQTVLTLAFLRLSINHIRENDHSVGVELIAALLRLYIERLREKGMGASLISDVENMVS